MNETILTYLIMIISAAIVVAINDFYYQLFANKKDYKNFLHWLRGIKKRKGKPTSYNKESDWRRYITRLCISSSLFIIITWLSFEYTNISKTSDYSSFQRAIVYTFPLLSIAYFCTVVLSIPFRESKRFEVNLRRLVSDCFISAVFMICMFSIAYRVHGICSGGSCLIGERGNALYFSAVTFSTLGFGDFAPSPNARPLAAIQALFGNLHLGIIAGALFATLAKLAERARLAREYEKLEKELEKQKAKGAKLAKKAKEAKHPNKQ